MKDYWKGLLVGTACTAVLFTVGIAAVKYENHGTLMADSDVTEKIVFLENMINTYYLDDFEQDTLKEGLYEGLVDSLNDPYSYYYTEEEYSEEYEASEGVYQGIGILMNLEETGIVSVIEVYKNSPAETAGVQVEDILLEINGESIDGMELSEISDLIREKEEAVILVERDGEPLELTVEIGEFEVPTVYSGMLENQIGYIQIGEFDGVTYDQFKEAYDELNEEGMEKLIVDLRNNPGGYLQTVCDILREILPEGLIVYTEDKYGNRSEETCDGTNEIQIPLVVLVNESSASSSEIFAGAVKDHEIGTLVGTTTYGKGIVQSVFSLKDGSAVQLTTSKYYTPDGNNIHKTGIEPDVVVEDDEETEDDEQLQKAIELLADR